ncbi:metallophosphoesterase family protein [Baekduia soli]|uniref:Metallophosphoesterase family protein n=1 Tax=Baekduia soli TaxID=496014 RepID=A0A5B8U4L1_9ACTN|nr:metallophosphoesterase family protein [Baekduia soli]QEC47798.1 metallophosphoesterase family protein [Baekduia soli]
MRAILYDVHGNLGALEAVLGDAERAGARSFLLGGDYGAFGPEPVACVARLRALGDAATWIRGNWERWQAGPAAAPETEVVQGAAAAVAAALGPDLVAELAALPTRVTIDGTLYCHASPPSDMEPIAREEDADADDQLLAGVTERRVVFGHTHVQFRRATTRGIELVNAGSVGLPFDGDTRAAYALVDDAGALQLRRVAYDVEATAGALDAVGAPWATTTAARLRAASFEL